MIPCNEYPPSTDEEWEEALKCYARDRERGEPAETKIVQDTSQQRWAVSSLSAGQDMTVASKPPLVHHGDSDDSFNADIGIPFHRPDNIPGPFKHIETVLEAPVDILQYDDKKLSDITEKEQSAQIHPIPIAFDTSRTGPGKRDESDFQNDDTRSAEMERRRMKEFYHREGWLPGPLPSRATRLKRRRAIRRLGLIGEEEDGRKAVLSKYAEMAELVFDVPQSSVAVIHDEKEFVYFSDPHKPPASGTMPQTICSHVIDIHDGNCWTIADCTTDWRTINNPLYADKQYKFMAAAPLRYHGKDGSLVDFGTLNIYDTQPRYSFTQRERSLLLKLANMLVYQLATQQSEYMAKRSSAMYEASISFLTRSIIPEPSEERRRRSSASTKSRSISPPPSPKAKFQPPNADENTQVASKTGPRDSRDARRQAFKSDQGIFNDAAATLRVLLKADAVVVVSLDDYHLFIKKQENAGPLHTKRGKDRIKTKEKIIIDYLKGEPWPSDIEPVINYVGRPHRAEVLGLSADRGTNFHLDTTGVESVLAEFLKVYLSTRQFWWDREENVNPLSMRIMDLMPTEAQTALSTTFMGHDGNIKFVTFATWNEPPSSLVDSSIVSLPFVWILGGCLMAALAMKKIRTLEQSQISYSNLQAHELRTPLHQILAITQLLRSSMTDLAETPQSPSSLTSTEQVRDLLPFLDAIDTSGRTLHGIVDNILSFLDLKGKEASHSLGDTGLMTTPSGAQTSLEVLFEEIIQDTIEEDRKSRKANGQAHCHIETIFEIIPPMLGEQVSEDAGGALRRALAKILANAYKFIETDGCVEIYVDDVVDLLPPEGCEGIALTKPISITVKDDGRGMDQAFVNDKLGEPWAKEDPYATGSGLSVHLAYRIVDLLGGCMEITSAPGAGTTVQIDVPLPLRSGPFPDSPSEPGSRRESTASIRQLNLHHNDMEIGRKVCLTGWVGQGPRFEMVGRALYRQYVKIGCEMVPTIGDAQLIVAYGGIEEDVSQAKELFEKARTKDIVFLITEEHSAQGKVLEMEKQMDLNIRRFKRPTNPSILRETLFPNHSERLKKLFDQETNGEVRVDSGSINTPHLMSPEGDDAGQPSTSADNRGTKRNASSPFPMSLSNFGSNGRSFPTNDNTQPSIGPESVSDNWKPSNMDTEEAVASLSLGEYFPKMSPKQTFRGEEDPSRDTTTPDAEEENDEEEESHATPMNENTNVDVDRKYSVATEKGSESGQSVSTSTTNHGPDSINSFSLTRNHSIDLTSGSKEDGKVKVMVVEDNKINRTLLVKLLQKQINLPIEILEAEDGQEAVDLFKKVTGPLIVLLDINMPKKDGYQTCTEMRLIEADDSHRKRSQIVAVTALASVDEKKRGLVECDMDDWYSKPCGKSVIARIINEAYQRLFA
ncbi:hypothetical protein L486_07485 [Kwoniella mangroviensis CBS 10435]|uniref:histidine kinase n=1 Tax=Kwoniella mangroviensis CBS 10435 TaxID=1331196 RepID=A0A1B9IHH6_9TREE|nr:hypothetical protein L486_07485 [Kwoniella mangroviensis CBS 10435]